MYTSWSVMGRFGLVSLGHGGFMGIGAYVTALLWNYLGLRRGSAFRWRCWRPLLVALLIAYPCFRFRIIGHYFALVTLALSAIVLQVITATRDYTGGSLGYTPKRYHGGNSIYALQFADKATWYLIALGVWAVGLLIRYRVDRSMLRYALEAIAEDEDAAAAAGVHVTWEKLKITLISAAMTAFAGALYCQYQMFISPDTVSGIAVSLQMVFAAVVGGIYVLLGPTVGAIITILLAEVLRIGFGTARWAGTTSSTARCWWCSSSSCRRAWWVGAGQVRPRVGHERTDGSSDAASSTARLMLGASRSERRSHARPSRGCPCRINSRPTTQAFSASRAPPDGSKPVPPKRAISAGFAEDRLHAGCERHRIGGEAR